MIRKPGESQLDYLWDNYGDTHVSNTLDDSNIIPTAEAVKKYVDDVALQSDKIKRIEIGVDGDPDASTLYLDNGLVQFGSNVLISLTDFDVLADKVTALENKCNSIINDGAISCDEFNGGNNLNDPTKAYLINKCNISTTAEIKAKSVTFTDSILKDNARLKVNASNVDSINLSVTGDFPKSNGGNAVISVNDAEYVTFKGLNFDSNDIYNGVEIALNSTTLPKNIMFENCTFGGAFTNNAISIFATQDNATITLSNCTFKDVSNCLRMSNKTGAKGVTINVVNCTVDKWEDATPNQGFLLFQDYTSISAGDADTKNLFGKDKITVNFTNLVHAGKKVVPPVISSVIATKDDNQVVYIWVDAKKETGNFIEYNEQMFPNITFK